MQKSQTQFFRYGSEADPIHLFNGETLAEVQLAYETYGTLNEARDNAVLLFHAFTGSQHAAGITPDVDGVAFWTEDCEIGWWSPFIGPDKALDTNRYFIICCNYLGGCYGSSGPSTINPATGNPFGGDFPHIRFADIVDSQVALLDHFGIERLHAVVGASLGGIQAAVLATRYPEKVGTVVCVSSGIHVSVLTRIQNFEQIFAIEQDAHFNGGNYYAGEHPDGGLALARMIAHKTYVSLDTLVSRASRDLRSAEPSSFYDFAHPVESYMNHQGRKFVDRFDANSYLRILDAWNRFDLAREAGIETIDEAFGRCKGQHWLVFSIDSDVCFYPDEQAEIATAAHQAGLNCQHITVHSSKGHDAFLLQPNLFSPHLSWFLSNQHRPV